jgi:hypothetical protein
MKPSKNLKKIKKIIKKTLDKRVKLWYNNYRKLRKRYIKMTIKELREIVENYKDCADTDVVEFEEHIYDHGYCDYYVKRNIAKIKVRKIEG